MYWILINRVQIYPDLYKDEHSINSSPIRFFVSVDSFLVSRVFDKKNLEQTFWCQDVHIPLTLASGFLLLFLFFSYCRTTIYQRSWISPIKSCVYWGQRNIWGMPFQNEIHQPPFHERVLMARREKNHDL